MQFECTSFLSFLKSQQLEFIKFLSIAIFFREDCQTNQSLDRIRLLQFKVLSHSSFAYYALLNAICTIILQTLHSVNGTVSIHMISTGDRELTKTCAGKKENSCIRVWYFSWRLHGKISGKKTSLLFLGLAPIISKHSELRRASPWVTCE